MSRLLLVIVYTKERSGRDAYLVRSIFVVLTVTENTKLDCANIIRLYQHESRARLCPEVTTLFTYLPYDVAHSSPLD